jgi:ureidoacrylate peracid hydrolase
MEPYVTTETINSKSEEWLEKIRPYNQHEMSPQRDKCALMVIDMQQFFLNPDSPTFTCGGHAIVPTLRRLIAAFRQAGRPVIFTKHVHHPDHFDSGVMGWWWEGMCVEGTPESEIHPDLAPIGNEKVVLKHRYSSFYNTDMETVLRCLKIEDIIISGVMTNLCCESTARDAYFRDYRVFALADGMGTINEEMHVASLMNLAFGFAHVTTVDVIAGQLQTLRSADTPLAPASGV